MNKKNFQKLIKATNVLTVWASLPLIGSLCFVYVLVGENIPSADSDPKLHQAANLLQNVCAGLIPVFILFIGSYLVLQKIQEIKQSSEKDVLVDEITSKLQEKITSLQDSMSSSAYFDALSKIVKEATFNVVDEINLKDRMLAPSICYYNQSSELLNRQKREFGTTSTYSFMSTSGVNFLNNAVGDIKDSESLVIKLLLMNPGVEKNIVTRYEQLKNHEKDKTPIFLKKEIIDSIYNAVSICVEKSRLDIHICLHDEAPLFRFEFTDREAYLSYYLSQESENNIGPVGVYEPNSIVFSAYREYFNDVWKRSAEKYCLSIHKGKSTQEVRGLLLETFRDNRNGLHKIIKSSCEKHCSAEESDRCENECPKKRDIHG